MLIVLTIFWRLRSPILRRILEMEWLPDSLTIWVLVLYLVSTFRLLNFRLEKLTWGGRE